MSMVSTFRFRHDGTAFEGHVDGDVLTLDADLGGLPFSAEDVSGRRQWLRRLAAADPRAADRFRLDAGNHVHLETRTGAASLAEKARLFEVLTVMVLAMRRDAVTVGPPRPGSSRHFRAEGRG